MSKQKTILELADDYAKAYFMGRVEDERKALQAKVLWLETDAYLVEQLLDKLASGLVPSTAEQLREEYKSGLDSIDKGEEE